MIAGLHVYNNYSEIGFSYKMIFIICRQMNR